MDQWESLMRSMGASDADIAHMRVTQQAQAQAVPMAPTPPPVETRTGGIPAAGPIAQSPGLAQTMDAIARAQQAQAVPGPAIGPRGMGAMGPQNPMVPTQPDLSQPTPQPPPMPPPAPVSTGAGPAPGIPSPFTPPAIPNNPQDPEASWAALQRLLQPNPQAAPAPGVPVAPVAGSGGAGIDMVQGDPPGEFSSSGIPFAARDLAAPKPQSPGATGPVTTSGGGGGSAPSLPAGAMPPNLASSAGISRPQTESADRTGAPPPGQATDWKSIIGIIGATLGMGPRRGETTGQLISRAMGNGIMAQAAQATSAQQQATEQQKLGLEGRRVAVTERGASSTEQRTAADVRHSDASTATLMEQIKLIPDHQTALRLENAAKAAALEADPAKRAAALDQVRAQTSHLLGQTDALTEKPQAARAKAWTTAIEKSNTGTGVDPETLILHSQAIPGLQPMSPADAKRFQTKFRAETAGMRPEQVQAAKLRAINDAFRNGQTLSGF